MLPFTVKVIEENRREEEERGCRRKEAEKRIENLKYCICISLISGECASYCELYFNHLNMKSIQNAIIFLWDDLCAN